MRPQTRRIVTWQFWLPPLLLLFLAATAYLPFVAQLGVYRDAWHVMRAGHSVNLSAVLQLFSVDRPFSGYLYVLFYRFLGEQILLWHLAIFILRYAGALACWGLARLLWPKAGGLALGSAALFAVYPGFLQQPDAATYVTFVTVMLGALLSLFLTVFSLGDAPVVFRAGAALAALLIAAGDLLLVEFLVGFEAVRLLLIWDLTGRSPGRLRRFALRALPYVLTVLAFLVWRVFFFHSSRPTTDLGALLTSYLESPLAVLGSMSANFLLGLFNIGLAAWAVPLSFLVEQVPPVIQWAGLLVGVLAGGMFALAARALPDAAGESARQAAWFGLLAMVLTYAPIVLLGRSASFGSPLIGTDRYTFQSSFAAALLLVALIGLVLPARASARAWVVGGLVALAVATHVYNGWLFAHSWQVARQYFWQLSWRAPLLEKGTLLTGQYPAMALTEGYQLSYPANLIYYPDSPLPQITGEVLTADTLPEFLREGTRPIERRTVPQLLNFANTLVAFLPREGACLQVVDGRRPVLPDNADALIRLVAPHSRLSDILTDAEPAMPPASIFGAEPPHGWCYYYQKVSLALQRGEYESAAGLADQARAGGFAAGDPSEWLPLAEAYVYAGQYEKAAPLLQIIAADRALAHQVCELLESNAFVPDLPSRAAHADFLYTSLCQP